MTPSARVSAAIDCLDRISSGEAAEKVLTTWARANRFAGSTDRRAIRDLVFTALRNRRSFAWIGGGETGRQIMLGAAHAAGTLEAWFDGQGYGPATITEQEREATRPIGAARDAVRHDVQDWIWELATRGVPQQSETLSALKSRAPVFLRVNTLKGPISAVREALTAEGIGTEPHSLSPTALKVTSNAPKVAASRAFAEGLVEMQDAASQACVDHIAELLPGASVLDFCAGGGGKSLAIAAFRPKQIFAYDAHAGRMKDIPARAARAGTKIKILSEPAGRHDVVFCDCPCSGSGAWRRQPEAKWTLTGERLAEICDLQDDILDRATEHVTDDGHLVYATCSILREENENRRDAFLERHQDWKLKSSRRFSPLEGGDGFFIAVFTRNS